MTKFYVVTCADEGERASVDAVFSTKEKADEYIKKRIEDSRDQQECRDYLRDHVYDTDHSWD